MSAHLLKGDDPILRADALDELIEQLLGSDDRTLAVEDLAVPGRGSDGEPGGADARAAVIGAAVNAAQSPPFMTAKREPSASSGCRGSNVRISDGLTANTASESRYRLSASKMCVANGS